MRTHSKDPQKRAEQKRTGWTDAETQALIRCYETMLELQRAGRLGRAQGQTSKAQMRRTFLATHAPHRSPGSFEAKCMNLSAVRRDLGLPIVDGYKPAANMSQSCRAIAWARWAPIEQVGQALQDHGKRSVGGDR